MQWEKVVLVIVIVIVSIGSGYTRWRVTVASSSAIASSNSDDYDASTLLISMLLNEDDIIKDVMDIFRWSIFRVNVLIYGYG